MRPSSCRSFVGFECLERNHSVWERRPRRGCSTIPQRPSSASDDASDNRHHHNLLVLLIDEGIGLGWIVAESAENRKRKCESAPRDFFVEKLSNLCRKLYLRDEKSNFLTGSSRPESCSQDVYHSPIFHEPQQPRTFLRNQSHIFPNLTLSPEGSGRPASSSGRNRMCPVFVDSLERCCLMQACQQVLLKYDTHAPQLPRRWFPEEIISYFLPLGFVETTLFPAMFENSTLRDLAFSRGERERSACRP